MAVFARVCYCECYCEGDCECVLCVWLCVWLWVWLWLCVWSCVCLCIYVRYFTFAGDPMKSTRNSISCGIGNELFPYPSSFDDDDDCLLSASSTRLRSGSFSRLSNAGDIIFQNCLFKKFYLFVFSFCQWIRFFTFPLFFFSFFVGLLFSMNLSPWSTSIKLN